jgi:hypothetical protein
MPSASWLDRPSRFTNWFTPAAASHRARDRLSETGKQGKRSANVLNPRLPRADAFIAAKRHYDPQLRFRNAMWDSHLG